MLLKLSAYMLLSLGSTAQALILLMKRLVHGKRKERWKKWWYSYQVWNQATSIKNNPKNAGHTERTTYLHLLWTTIPDHRLPRRRLARCCLKMWFSLRKGFHRLEKKVLEYLGIQSRRSMYQNPTQSKEYRIRGQMKGQLLVAQSHPESRCRWARYSCRSWPFVTAIDVKYSMDSWAKPGWNEPALNLLSLWRISEW